MSAPDCEDGKHQHCAEDACPCHCHDWEVPLPDAMFDVIEEET